MIRYIFFASILLNIIGCSGAGLLGLAEKPEAKLKTVYVKDADFTGATLIFVVDVKNPNRFDIEVKEVAYKVFIGDKEMTTAKTDKVIKVPASKAAEVELPLPIKYSSLLEHLGSALIARELPYKIEGDAKFSFVTIPFKKEGKVELR